VRYSIRDAPETFGACHCTMCQRISGGVNLSLAVSADRIEIEGQQAVRSYRSSARAARSFCGTCGANLWYRSTDTPQPAYHVAFGSLDDKTGMRFAVEICVETRPDAYAFAGDRPQKRSEQVLR
jgi:hypothetical protein